MRHAVALGVVILGLALPTAAAATGPRARPAGVTWGGTHFVAEARLAAWLAARGITYRDWVRTHPRAHYLMTHPRPAPQIRRPRVAAPDSSGPVSDARVSGSTDVVAMVFIILAGLCVAAGVAGRAIIGVVGAPVDAARLASVRVGLVASGIMLAVAVSVALLN
ncbi:MAG TPA: hypothetical protein VFU51_15245 [Gaiellaceae bacterium]|nr:hypothetical protein [Gaiellaceae bacterium]